ncbi:MULTISPECIES: pyruvate kinase [Thermodesulfobacterium]|jgi:pyruvate kinase|uniref:Pyruvate kinase n=2 Tax=Thermodesulfobacterium commune TaxID=1741 RepID=A0A075WR03_9BACT|nr:MULTISPECIES: pyruvate kinase [Thermodesulfobacterium]KUJ97465.1 MAG: Pyruvate kinase [Thermodesulfobacterium sp. 37_54]KUK18882.1 MAG: Pyruvate kinase [Thermodesulfobacterium commune]AIH03739.1 pyruvate kinase [Thermodesulfobacterium commune DSM 2178]KUK37606.1 MAG: Pyruvate kinase [Thermodesulfobacterium commune]MBZ4682171.1 pyruvate kinase [Thermodesulfobacterium sp.]
MKKTKIVATIGPKTQNLTLIKKLIKAGVNVFRLNFSHGDHEYHKQSIKLIRRASAELKLPVGILQDLSGPKIRIGEVKKPFLVHAGEILELHKTKILGEKTGDCFKVSVEYPEILEDLKEKDLIYVADGLIKLRVIKVLEDRVITEVLQGGVISSKKGLNFPGVSLSIPAFTPKDREDLLFGLQNEIDFVALSFVNRKEDVLACKEVIEKFGKGQPVFAKIETQTALENIEEILEVADGLMVARGDLGVEVPIERVPVIQKVLVEKGRKLGKPVIIATQMLTSMIDSTMPTRADVSDIANAVLDGADALMLSDETAIGNFPVECVKMMVKIIKEAEKLYPYLKETYQEVSSDFAIAYSSCVLASEVKAKAIVVFTKSGSSAMRIAKFRPKELILANVHDEEILRRLTVVWGVYPCFVLSEVKTIDSMVKEFLVRAYQQRLINKKDTLVLTMGYPVGKVGSTNLIRLIKPDQIQALLES